MGAALLQRHKRQAPKKPENAAVTLPENLDLGDSLADKLKQEQIEMEQKIGNMTCVMREIGVLNQQNELDFAAQKRAFEKFNIPNQWLKNRLLNDMELCNKVADSLPSETRKEYNFPGLINMSQVNSYLNCCKYSKMRPACTRMSRRLSRRTLDPLIRSWSKLNSMKTSCSPWSPNFFMERRWITLDSRRLGSQCYLITGILSFPGKRRNHYYQMSSI